MKIHHKTDLRPLISHDNPDVYFNVKDIIDFFRAQVIKATQGEYEYANIITVQSLVDDDYNYFVRVVFSGLDGDEFHLDINLIEDGEYHTFISLENFLDTEDELYPYMLGVREMAKAIFTDRCDRVEADDCSAPGTYFILSCDINSILDNFIRAMQMVEVHLNLVREAEEEEEEE